MWSTAERGAAALGLLLALGCGAEPAAPPVVQSLLPGDYDARFVQVRDCRDSNDHDLNRILVKVEAGLQERYERGPYPFPVGTVIVKEEFADPGCAQRVGWTLMYKEAPGYDARFGDWRWQRLDAAGNVKEDGKLARCAGCHAVASCRARDFACAEP